MRTLTLAFIFLTSALTAADHPFDQPPGSRPYTYRPSNSHILLGFALDSHPGQSSIELEDRSVWTCSDSYNGALQYWRQDDTLKVIYTSCTFFGCCEPFVIKNLRTGDAVTAKMILTPDDEGPFTYFVYEIKGNKLTMMKRNKVKTTYEVCRDDIEYLDELKRGHIVFIAENQEWCTKSSHPFVLFAWTSDGTCLKAKRIN